MEKPTIHSRKQPHIRDRALRAVRTVNFEPAPGPVPSAAVRIRHQITSIVSRIAPLRLTNSSRTTLDRLTNGSRPLVPCSRPLSTRAPPALDHSRPAHLPLSTTLYRSRLPHSGVTALPPPLHAALSHRAHQTVICTHERSLELPGHVGRRGPGAREPALTTGRRTRI